MFSYTYQLNYWCYSLIVFQTLHFYQKFTILKNFQIRIKVTEWCTDWVGSDFKISLKIVHNLYSCLPNKTLMLRHRIFFWDYLLLLRSFGALETRSLWIKILKQHLNSQNTMTLPESGQKVNKANMVKMLLI